jgi:hypothetical protein
MRRSNRGRCSKEGYIWFRFQESKAMTIFFIILFLFTLSPFYTDIKIDTISHLALTLITGIFSKYIFTEFYIASEDDGIYLEVNRRRYIKLMGWEQHNYSFVTIDLKYNKFSLHNKEIILTSCGKNTLIHQPLCKKMHNFFSTSCKELHDVYRRNHPKSSFT